MKSRREFLKESGSIFGSSWLSVNAPMVLAVAQAACVQRDAGAAWRNLSDTEADGFAAIADQIIPPDESPGASEIGVVYFLDQALGGFMSSAEKLLKDGLADLDRRARTKSQKADVFADLPFDAQTVVLKGIEHSRMFKSMTSVIQLGMFALPEYGGNRGYEGWKLIGFDYQHAWQPPFGYYDEQYSDEEENLVES